jgi:transcriptional regulator with GAF, ATPase, and Fis domain
VKNNQWLISWIGNADHDASEKGEAAGLGPIATALQGGLHFERVCLLTNFPYERSAKFCEWLENKCGYSSSVIDLQEMDLLSPIHYASIYDQVSKHLKALGLPREHVDRTFHLSPGTPAMAAIWIMLAKTRFPAKLIQTSKEHGLESVDFKFDLASDFLPEYLQRSGERIERLANGPQEAVPHFGKIIHKSLAVKSQIHLAQRIAAHDVPVLILGETGTGKELFAEAIQAASDRAQKPFIAVNCGAIAPELASSELFGHVKGAFTGALVARKGHFQEADGGTLFLDEVGDLPPDTQVRLLRALQAKEVTPLGDSKPIKVDVRIIAATHRDLAADVASGRFREDLFHRLAVGILRLPPLREREGDVDLLIDTFLELINADARGKPEAQDKKISFDARKILISYPWPGNIRELYHSLLRASIWSIGEEIQSDDVRSALLQVQSQGNNVMTRPLTQGFDLQALLDEISSDYILRALKQTGDRKTTAAQLLGFTNHQTLSNWMKRLDLDLEENKN